MTDRHTNSRRDRYGTLIYKFRGQKELYTSGSYTVIYSAETTNSGERKSREKKTDVLRSIGKQSGEFVESVQEKKW